MRYCEWCWRGRLDCCCYDAFGCWCGADELTRCESLQDGRAQWRHRHGPESQQSDLGPDAPEAALLPGGQRSCLVGGRLAAGIVSPREEHQLDQLQGILPTLIILATLPEWLNYLWLYCYYLGALYEHYWLFMSCPLIVIDACYLPVVNYDESASCNYQSIID